MDISRPELYFQDISVICPARPRQGGVRIAKAEPHNCGYSDMHEKLPDASREHVRIAKRKHYFILMIIIRICKNG